MNDATLKIFLQKYKPTQPDCPLEKIKGIDAGMLPPCNDVLNQKLARCNYVAYLWKCAHRRDPLANINPTDHDWKEINEVFLPLWITGSQIPTMLSENIDPTDFSDGEDDNDEGRDSITEDDSEDEDDSDVD